MSSKQMDALVAKLRSQKADVTKRGNRWRITQAGKPLAWLPTADPRGQGLDNKLSELRRKGYQV